ncbi:MAG: AzlD domain-containing protein [Anaerolineae bacterium]|nr:AzlD domain-containing protein [Anaerolineae bacterium]
MSNVQLAVAILGMGLITYAIRLSLFLLPGRVVLPPWMLATLRYVPAAVLTAIIFPGLLMPDGTLDISLGNEHLLAGLAATVVAWRTRNVFLTVAVGMILLWLFQAYSPF